MLIQSLFYLFGTILVLAAIGVISARNPVYSALALVMCFVTSAAIWLLLEAEFLAVCARGSRASPGSAGSPRSQ
jgi:NADH:ubiquinone oxidoreductase subunit 6 (subunit J)